MDAVGILGLLFSAGVIGGIAYGICIAIKNVKKEKKHEKYRDEKIESDTQNFIKNKSLEIIAKKIIKDIFDRYDYKYPKDLDFTISVSPTTGGVNSIVLNIQRRRYYTGLDYELIHLKSIEYLERTSCEFYLRYNHKKMIDELESLIRKNMVGKFCELKIKRQNDKIIISY